MVTVVVVCVSPVCSGRQSDSTDKQSNITTNLLACARSDDGAVVWVMPILARISFGALSFCEEETQKLLLFLRGPRRAGFASFGFGFSCSLCFCLWLGFSFGFRFGLRLCFSLWLCFGLRFCLGLWGRGNTSGCTTNLGDSSADLGWGCNRGQSFCKTGLKCLLVGVLFRLTDCFTDFVYEIVPRSLARFLGAVFDFVYMPLQARDVFHLFEKPRVAEVLIWQIFRWDACQRILDAIQEAL